MLLQFVFLAILEDAIVSIGPWIQVVTSISLLQHGVHSVLSCLYRQGRRKPMLRRCRDHSRWSGCSEDQKDGHFSESIPFCLECDGSPMRSGWKGICCGSYSVWPLVLFLSPNHTSDSWHSKFEFTVEIPQSTLVSSISQRISCSHILLFNLVKISSPGPAMACYGLLWPAWLAWLLGLAQVPPPKVMVAPPRLRNWRELTFGLGTCPALSVSVRRFLDRHSTNAAWTPGHPQAMFHWSSVLVQLPERDQEILCCKVGST